MCFIVVLAVLGVPLAYAQPSTIPNCGSGPATGATVIAAMRKARASSYPELVQVQMSLQEFHSTSDYFRTRFSLPRFFFLMPMRYSVQVNPDLFSQGAPQDGVCAILAHELAHVAALSHGNRIRRFNLIRLMSAGYTRRFERKTDLEAIRRGYGDGLKVYRTWVYAHIPPEKLAEKRRRYFSAEEIERIQQVSLRDPSRFVEWSRQVPMRLEEIH